MRCAVAGIVLQKVSVNPPGQTGELAVALPIRRGRPPVPRAAFKTKFARQIDMWGNFIKKTGIKVQ